MTSAQCYVKSTLFQDAVLTVTVIGIKCFRCVLLRPPCFKIQMFKLVLLQQVRVLTSRNICSTFAAVLSVLFCVSCNSLQARKQILESTVYHLSALPSHKKPQGNFACSFNLVVLDYVLAHRGNASGSFFVFVALSLLMRGFPVFAGWLL